MNPALTHPLVSIILPAYNAGLKLSTSVNSIINQSISDWELIILDDGSSDNSLEYIKSLNDPRILIYQDGLNRGLAYRLNQGILLAKAAFIARMDADDISFPYRLELQLNCLLKNSEIDLVSSRALVFNNSDLSIIGLLPYKETHEDITSSLWKTIPMPHPTWMGRAEWFKKFKYKFPEIVRAEDQELLLRTYRQSKFYCIPLVLLDYRQHPFNFNKTWVARKSLIKVQMTTFWSERAFLNIFKVMGFSIIKVMIDVLAAIPFFNFFFFMRMSSEVPELVKKEFYDLLAKLETLN